MTFDPDRDLLPTCLALRMAHNGSADPISDEKTAEVLDYLRRRIAEWTAPHPLSARFDECVRQLVLATIDEVTAAQAREAEILGRMP